MGKTRSWDPQFNIDGTLRDNSSDSRIDGISRDEHGDILAYFSKLIGHSELNLAELLALKKAILIFVATGWRLTQPFFFFLESDSHNVVQ